MDELNLKDDDPRKISRNDLLWYNQNKKAITTAAATYTIIQNIDILICTATCTVTSKATRGRELHIKKRFAGTAITVNPNGSETIDGAASLSMTATNEAQWLKAISGNWIVL